MTHTGPAGDRRDRSAPSAPQRPPGVRIWAWLVLAATLFLAVAATRPVSRASQPRDGQVHATRPDAGQPGASQPGASQPDGSRPDESRGAPPERPASSRPLTSDQLEQRLDALEQELEPR